MGPEENEQLHPVFLAEDVDVLRTDVKRRDSIQWVFHVTAQ
jgi:hypothetical protein